MYIVLMDYLLKLVERLKVFNMYKIVENNKDVVGFYIVKEDAEDLASWLNSTNNGNFYHVEKE